MTAPKRIILGVDPAKVSGWCLLAATQGNAAHLTSGTARSQQDREAVAVRLAALTAQHECPCVVAAETWGAYGRFGGARTQRGLGEAWGMWRAELDRVGIPARRVVRVYPVQWRAAVLGMGGKGATSDVVRVRARAYAHERYGWTCATDDEAEAICIATWAIGARESAHLWGEESGG